MTNLFTVCIRTGKGNKEVQAECQDKVFLGVAQNLLSQQQPTATVITAEAEQQSDLHRSRILPLMKK